MILGWGQLGSIDAQLGGGVSGAVAPVLLPDNIIVGTLTNETVVRTLTGETVERTLSYDGVVRTLTFDG